MFCNNCGNRNEDNVKFCAFCGAPIRGFASPPSSFNAPVNANVAAFDSTSSSAKDYVGSDCLILSILLNVLNCLLCFILPSAIAALCFSIAARSAKASGQWEKALVRATVAKTLCWATLGAGVIIACVAVYHMYDPDFRDRVYQSVDKSLNEGEIETPDVPWVDAAEDAVDDALDR